MNLQASDILTLESSRIIRASHGEFRTPDSRKKQKCLVECQKGKG